MRQKGGRYAIAHYEIKVSGQIDLGKIILFRTNVRSIFK